MMHMASILPKADGATDVLRDAPAASADASPPAGGAASLFDWDAAVEDWDFIGPETSVGTKGAKLWGRVRSRVDMLARMQGMSRAELLIYVLLTLAAHRATASESEREGESSLLFG